MKKKKRKEIHSEEKVRIISVGRINLAVTAVFVVFAFWLMAVKNGFMMQWMEEFSLFEPTRFFFRRCLMYPGGMLRYAGSWLTQFMYHPWLGSLVLVVLWMMIAWLTRKAFRLSKAAWPLCLIVPLALLVSIVQIDEAWLSLKTIGYLYSNTLGYLFTMATFTLWRELSDRRILSLFIALLIVCLYCIAGFFALLGGALCILAYGAEIVGALLNSGDRPASGPLRNLIASDAAGVLITAVAIYAVPVLYYTYVPGNTVDNDYLYLKGLPELLMESYDIYLWMPFIVASGWLLILASARLIPIQVAGASRRWMIACEMLILVCGFAWTLKAEQKNEQLRATVLMLQRMDEQDWNGMLMVMSRIKNPPNYTMKMYRNLALVNLGNKGEKPEFKPVKTDGRHAEGFTMTAFLHVPFFYNIGRINESYRWAMEHTVQYGKRVFFLKYMVRSALLRGKPDLARKYNDMLKKTMFHKEWAERMQKYIDDPSLIESAQEFKTVRSFM